MSSEISFLVEEVLFPGFASGRTGAFRHGKIRAGLQIKEAFRPSIDPPNINVDFFTWFESKRSGQAHSNGVAILDDSGADRWGCRAWR